MISDFFIARPVLANVLAILMMVVGAVALFALPVAQYPDVVPPTVQVTTRYPGASARTVIDAVALPIEQQVNGVEGMIYMQSFSGADGSYSLTVTFGVGAELNQSQVLVQNRVSSALALLPQAVQAQGVVVQKNSTAILQIVTLTAPDARYDSLYLANYATIRLKDEVARLPGVGSVTVFGAGQYSMRIWLDPEKMRARSLVPQDLVQALQQQSSRVTAGQIGMPPAPAGQTFQYTLNVAGKLSDPDEFGAIIVKTGRIAATALISAINAVTLKPTQSAMWLRPAVPPEERNVLYRLFNRGYERVEHWYARLIAAMVHRSGLMAIVALAIIAVSAYGFARLPTGFLPIEDQGYLIALLAKRRGCATSAASSSGRRPMGRYSR